MRGIVASRQKSKNPPPGAKRGRKPLLENRPDRDEILAELIAPGANLASISRRIGVSHDILARFRDKWLPLPIRNMLNRYDPRALEAAQLDVLSRFIDTIEKSHKMLTAADLWLRDPDDPSVYNLNPRTHEVDIVFEERPSTLGDACPTCGHQKREVTSPVPIRKTEKLWKLMDDVERGLGITVVKGETKIADTRKLLLEAAATMKPILEVYGRSTGQIKSDPAVSLNLFLASPDWKATQAALVEAVREHPDAAQKIALALEEVGKK